MVHAIGLAAFMSSLKIRGDIADESFQTHFNGAPGQLEIESVARSACETRPILVDRLAELTSNLIESVLDFIKEPVAFNARHDMRHFNIAQRVRSATICP